MPNIVSIVTAAHAPHAQYLADAYQSLVAQTMPAGWAWEWLVQEDGETGLVATALPQDTRIRPGTSIARGPAVARTMALARSKGSLIKNLDADDILTPGALGRDIDVLARKATVGWTTSRVLDLLSDGTTSSWVYEDPNEGQLPSGTILSYYRAHSWRLFVHPTTLCIRRELAVALGGWMALSGSEDTGLLMAADAVTDGYFIHEPSILYRKHSGQETVQAHYTDLTERTIRAALIAARADALRELISTPKQIHSDV